MTKRSPLHEDHLSTGARLADFAGWQMPMQYTSVLAEHAAVRSEAGLFDVSHLGNVFVAGPAAGSFLESWFPGRIEALPEGAAGYNLALTQDGGIADDLFVYRRPDDFMVVPNAANTEEVAAGLAKSAPAGVSVKDESQEWAIMAFSGPAATRTITREFPETSDLKLHRFTAAGPAGSWMVARTGYTGEPTFEFFVPAADAPGVWGRLLSVSGVKVIPAGLAARDLLRLEMGYPLHGSDIGRDTNPLEAGLEWLIDWNKDFIGKQKLLEVKDMGLTRRLAGLVGKGKEIPRAGYAVYRAAGDGPKAADAEVGRVTSGNFSPTLRTGIALAYVAAEVAAPGTQLEIDVRGRLLDVEVIRPPFIRKPARAPEGT